MFNIKDTKYTKYVVRCSLNCSLKTQNCKPHRIVRSGKIANRTAKAINHTLQCRLCSLGGLYSLDEHPWIQRL